MSDFRAMREIVAPVKPVLLITSAVASISASRSGFCVSDLIGFGVSDFRAAVVGLASTYAL